MQLLTIDEHMKSLIYFLGISSKNTRQPDFSNSFKNFEFSKIRKILQYTCPITGVRDGQNTKKLPCPDTIFFEKGIP